MISMNNMDSNIEGMAFADVFMTLCLLLLIIVSQSVVVEQNQTITTNSDHAHTSEWMDVRFEKGVYILDSKVVGSDINKVFTRIDDNIGINLLMTSETSFSGYFEIASQIQAVGRDNVAISCNDCRHGAE